MGASPFITDDISVGLTKHCLALASALTSVLMGAVAIAAFVVSVSLAILGASSYMHTYVAKQLVSVMCMRCVAAQPC